MRRPTIAQLATGLAAAVCLAFAALLLIVPRATNTVPLVVLTGSMTPTYGVGSMVYVETLPPERVQVGDVITYQSKTTTNVISHRVVSIADDAGQPVFTTKGDANESIDSDAVTVDRYRGTVRFGIPFIGFVRDFVASPLGLTGLALAAAAAYAADRFRRNPQPQGKERSIRRADPVDAPSDTAEGVTPSSAVRFEEVQIGSIGGQQLLLIRAATNTIRRGDLLRVIELLAGRVHSVSSGELVASFVGDGSRLDDIESLLRAEHRILEVVRSETIRLSGATVGNTMTGPSPEASPPDHVDVRPDNADARTAGAFAPPPPPPSEAHHDSVRAGSDQIDAPTYEPLPSVAMSA